MNESEESEAESNKSTTWNQIMGKKGKKKTKSKLKKAVTMK